MGNVGSATPTNRTGRNVVAQKLDRAAKTGILSLQEHDLQAIPPQVFLITTLTTLDVSKNKLTTLGTELAKLVHLKLLNCDDNNLPAGSLVALSTLTKLQTLSAGGNQLGRHSLAPSSHHHHGNPRHRKAGAAAASAGAALEPMPKVEPLPSQLPLSLKQVKLDRNYIPQMPPALLQLSRLEKLDLSHNQLAALPDELDQLQQLNELLLDYNLLVALPESVGRLASLKTLSLKGNHIAVGHSSVAFSEQNPQPLPAILFTDTPLIVLNLHGNPLTNTQLNQFEGFAVFLERRQKLKTRDIYGGAMTNLDTCGIN